jgi:hypothetical protein
MLRDEEDECYNFKKSTLRVKERTKNPVLTVFSSKRNGTQLINTK